MKVASGLVYSDGRLFRGYIAVSDGRVIEVAEGDPPISPEWEGLLLPPLTNCHTHIGDRCLRGRIPDDIPLEELVRPPSGLKHRWLSECDDSEVIGGMRLALDELLACGTGLFVDFREGGLHGLDQLRHALERGGGPRAVVLSRPKRLEYLEAEVESLLSLSDGIGVSAITDWEYGALARMAEHVHRRGKLLALHASEGVREDIDSILSLEPDFLVHMSSASESDLELCATEGVPIVLCPRSNRRFGLETDISTMLDIGIVAALGTDNAMLGSLSLVDEMRAAYNAPSNSRRLETIEVLKLAIDSPRKVLNDKTLISGRPGSPCEFVVVRAAEGYSPEAILGKGSAHSVEVVSPERQVGG